MRIHSCSPAGARRARLGFIASVVAIALLASCNEPQAPGPAGDGSMQGNYNPSGSTLELRLESPTGGVSALRLLASDLTFDANTQELHAQVSIRNSGSEPLPGPDGVLLGGFDPAAVSPRNAQPLPCPACVGCPCPWPWQFDHRGTYGDGVLSPGETSTPVEWIFVDPAGESFSFRALLQGAAVAPGVISGSVFSDANANGHRDPGETGIAGASLTLVHGDVATSAQTDERGHYAFNVAEPGLYEVVRNETNACRPTSPLRQQIIILRRADGSLTGFDHADFGCGGIAPGDSATTVVGILFNDQNRNGLHEDGETGIAGVLITANMLLCPTFAAIETHTDEHGLYRIQLGCEPPYSIGHAPVPGTVDTSPNPVFLPGRRDGTGTTLPPDPSGPVVRVNFGVARSGPPQETFIEGFVFHDVNRNGVRERGEAGVADIGVSAGGLLCANPVAAFTRTDVNGHYRLNGTDVHCPLPWLVGREPRPGLCDTSQNPAELHAPPPSDGIFRQDFGVARCDSIPPAGFTIEGFVFFDLNQNGVHDRMEPGVPNAVLYLASPCDILLEADTDANGHYVFGPELTAHCPFDGVVQAQPVFPHHTTPNPFPIDPATVPPGSVVRADFGVLPIPPPR